MIVAGIGCQKGVSADEILAALDAACAGHGAPGLLAAVETKRGEAGLVEAAARRGLALRIVDASAVDEDRLASRSTASLAATGAASASEAAALGAAGPGARLLGPRLALGRVTCALAISEEDA